jgi:hypothetical protein
MKALLCILFFLPLNIIAPEKAQISSEKFWEQLAAHCGNAYQGEITAGAVEGDSFTGKKLVMHVGFKNE